MESASLRNKRLAAHSLEQMAEACALIEVWNGSVTTVNDYLTSPEGMQTMAASCMLIESIGEGLKKIDKLLPGFLNDNAPDVPWASIKGLRDHIAHGYFNLDADIIFDVAVNEIAPLKRALEQLRDVILSEIEE